MSFVQQHPRGIAFKVYVQPRSSKNMIVGTHGDALKVKLTAPPVGGAANRMCVQFLAKILGVPKSDLEILSGQSSRTKRLLLCCRKDGITHGGREQQRQRVESLLVPSAFPLTAK